MDNRTIALVDFILQHGHPVHGVDPHGNIVVESIFTNSGMTYRECEVIEPTIKAVRDWLGY